MNRGGGVHTVPSPTGKGWCNEVNGKVLTRHRLKESAEEAGREIARRLRIDHVIASPAGAANDEAAAGSFSATTTRGIDGIE